MMTKPPTLSDLGKARLLLSKGDPLFLAHWERALFIHFEVDPEVLQAQVPLPLDLYQGRAYVSLVAFTMRDLRPRFGGKLTKALFRPIATHTFLNVRTYVKNGDESGIFFMAEWVPNRLAAFLGPRTFGLPYRLGQLDYHHDHEAGELHGEVWAGRGAHGPTKPHLAYRATLGADTTYDACGAETLDAFLLERYTAYTIRFGKLCFFRIWHPPWSQTPVDLKLEDASLLLEMTGPARFVGAHYTVGAKDVWMGRPHRLQAGL